MIRGFILLAVVWRWGAVVRPAGVQPRRQRRRRASPQARRTIPTAFAGFAILPSFRRRAQVYRDAQSGSSRRRHSREPGTWAVVLDADETVISNASYQLERARLGLPFTHESWNAWVKRREATPLAGAPAFMARVRALGGRIAIVTNRLQSECADTEAVFKAPRVALRRHVVPARWRRRQTKTRASKRRQRTQRSRGRAARDDGVCRRQHPRFPARSIRASRRRAKPPFPSSACASS